MSDESSLQEIDFMQSDLERSERTKLLDRLPIKDIEHLGRPLREHLIGTHDLLDRWQNSEAVCLAGLFHSIYGTKTFTSATLTTKSRHDVRMLIGDEAEDLVFVFCMSDRKRLLLENRSPPYRWIDHRSGEQTEISGEILSDLVEIEVANSIEQMPFLADKADPVTRDMRHRFESTISRMSDGAREAFRLAFHEDSATANVSG